MSRQQFSTSNSAIVHINKNLEKLTASKRKVAQYVLDNLEQSLFLSANQIAEAVAVDTATVVRTAKSLGYGGYPQFQEALRETFLKRFTPLNIMKESIRESETDMVSSIVEILDEDGENIRMLRNSIDPAQLQEFVAKIYRAPNTLIVAFDLAAGLGLYFEYLLQALRFPVIAATRGGGSLRNKLRRLRPGDLLIAISFRRGLREVVRALEFAHEHDIDSVAVTDSFASPLLRYSHSFFLTPINTSSFAGSFVAPLALINAVAFGCGQYDQQRTLAILENIEEEYQKGDRWY